MLSLDRPFSYELSEEIGAGLGSLVQVPFHGRAVRGWVLGATEEIPSRMLPVKKLVSLVRFFDGPMLELLRWVSERYVAPLASVIGRSYPPRVASEEGPGAVGAPRRSAPRPTPLHSAPGPLRGYSSGAELLGAIAGGTGAFVLRPAPEEEVEVAVECVDRALDAGRSAIVLVPETEPLPATARGVLDAVGDAGVLFAGGDRRTRYRTWLDIAAGRYACVVGTRPAVFAPVPDLGLVYISRESHAQHREERSPYYHVRDVSRVRAELLGAVCAMSALHPSLETRTIDHVEVEPAERRWPPVEVVRPGPEGRAPRLVAALRSVRRGFLYAPLPGYGVARVCRRCGEPAACAACGGLLRSQEGSIRCAVCGASGRCASCDGSDFGIVRGGAERVEEWARTLAPVPVARVRRDQRSRPPADAEVLVGGAEAVKDFGPLGLDLVGILDADLASRRPGLGARERALATWFEAAAWAAPRGRVIVQTAHPNDPAVQALVTGRPDRFSRAELPRLADAGFPVGAPVFRVLGTAGLEGEMRALGPRTLLAADLGNGTACLVVLAPERVAAFGVAMRALAERGVVTRVEAEPHL